MQIDVLIFKLKKLQELYPTAMVYFTSEIDGDTWETWLEEFNVDEESDEIEIKFTTDWKKEME